MKVGLAYLYMAPFEGHTDGSKPVYGAGMEAAKMISVDLSYEKSEAEGYANNTLVESDNAITGGTLTMEGDHFSGPARKMAFGVSEVDDGDGKIYRTRNKTSPYVGCGFIQVEQVSGEVIYKATWVYKTQFSPQGVSAKTKSKNTEYTGTQVSGRFMGVQVDTDEAAFVDDRDFTTLGAAQAWLKTLAKITDAA